jgi:hypothetical protein
MASPFQNPVQVLLAFSAWFQPFSQIVQVLSVLSSLQFAASCFTTAGDRLLRLGLELGKSSYLPFPKIKTGPF